MAEDFSVGNTSLLNFWHDTRDNQRRETASVVYNENI